MRKEELVFTSSRDVTVNYIRETLEVTVDELTDIELAKLVAAAIAVKKKRRHTALVQMAYGKDNELYIVALGK